MTRTKIDWRRALLLSRRELRADVRAAANAAIGRTLTSLPALAQSGCVLAYEACGSEVDPIGLDSRAQELGKPLYVPRRLATGWTWQLRSAGGNDAVDIDAIGPGLVLMIVPGVGFDLEGRRLGRGAGFYDRTLAALRRRRPVLAIGVAFEAQIAAVLPEDPWDERVDVIVTEQRLIDARDDASGVGVRGKEMCQ